MAATITMAASYTTSGDTTLMSAYPTPHPFIAEHSLYMRKGGARD
jgi:hypothetical protein